MPPVARILSTPQRLFSLFILLAALAGCERAGPLESDPIDDNQPVSFSAIQSRIFDTSCAFSDCHAGDNPRMGMDLSAGQAFSNIVNVPSEESALDRIEPGEPENSYLLKKIRGDADIAGMKMPLGRTPLSAENIELLRRWIEEGAGDD